MAAKTSLSSVCRTCRRRQLQLTPSRRSLSTTTIRRAEDDEPTLSSPSRLGRRFIPRPNQQKSVPQIDALAQFSEIMTRSKRSEPIQDRSLSAKPPSGPSKMTERLRYIRDRASDEALTRPSSQTSSDEPYHLNVFSHKHNLHITFTEPSRNPILSFSNGNLGLRKAQRATYDAAYQLCAYTFRKMAEKSWRLGGKKMTSSPMLTLGDVAPGSARVGAAAGAGLRSGTGPGIEVVLRGFGPGREAFQKALLGNEGRMIKPMIVKVTDSTRLKFGGTRSPQVRRLG